MRMPQCTVEASTSTTSADHSADPVSAKSDAPASSWTPGFAVLSVSVSIRTRAARCSVVRESSRGVWAASASPSASPSASIRVASSGSAANRCLELGEVGSVVPDQVGVAERLLPVVGPLAQRVTE